MKQLFISIIILLFTTISISAQEAVYRVSFDAETLVKVKNGREIPGEAQVRVHIYGKKGEVLGGKVANGVLPTITIDEEDDIGKVTAVEVTLNGSGWSKSIKINTITVKKTVETEDDEIFKKYSFPCGCTLTQGNEFVHVDAGGTMDFEEDEAAIAEEEMEDFELEGEFSTADVSARKDGKVKYTISAQTKKEKTKVRDLPKETEVLPNGNTRICTTKKVTASASFDKNFLTNPTTQAIFPGAMIYAEDITSGKYRNIKVAKGQAPINISTDVAILGGDPVRKVENPSLSSVRVALNNMLVQSDRGDATIAANYKIYEVDTKEELSIELGGHFENASVDVDAQFNYKSNTETSLKVIQFAQIYYTVDVDMPFAPENMFNSPKDAQEVLESGGTPLYVSSVAYGQIAYFFMRTSLSEMEINAKLDAIIRSGVTEAEINAAVDYLKSRSESEMHALILGGSPADGVPIGYDEFLDMLRNGGELSKDALGKPVSYTLRFLNDNSIARVNLTTDYVKRTCKEVGDPMQNVSFQVHSITSNDDMEVRGDFQIQIGESPNTRVNWQRSPKINFFSEENPADLTSGEAYGINKNKTYGKIDTRKFDDLYIGIKVWVKEFDCLTCNDDTNESYNTIKLSKILSLDDPTSAKAGDQTSTGSGTQNIEVTVDGVKYTIKYSVSFD